MSSIHHGIQLILDDFKRTKGDYRVLEAGCGSSSHLDMGIAAKLTGIDISQKQLDRNEVLHDKILGDVETYPLSPDTYDLVVSWDVLEHLANPRAAVDNLVQATVPGGLVVLKLPNLLSLKGLVTRFTPHGFHVWFYRKYYKRADAGTADLGPFKTYLCNDVRPGALRKYARANNLEIVLEEYAEAMIQQRLKQRNLAYKIGLMSMGWLLRLVTLGAVVYDRTEYLIVLRKPMNESAGLTRSRSRHPENKASLREKASAG